MGAMDEERPAPKNNGGQTNYGDNSGFDDIDTRGFEDLDNMLA